MNASVTRKLYNTLAIVAYLMDVVAPGTDWRKRLIELLGNRALADTTLMGFPENWKQLPAWKV